jgi:AcrR family transcriptional regulator
MCRLDKWTGRQVILGTAYVNLSADLSQSKKPTVGRPPKYSRPQLQDAALALIDQGGVPALTMRRLAEALGTGPMTLYNHVADRADIDLLVVEAVMASVQLPDAERGDWQDEIRAVALAVWRAVRAHPQAIPLILTRSSSSAATLRVMEALLRPLARGGHTGQDLLIAFRAVTGIIIGAAQAEVAGPLAAQAGETAETIFDRYGSLPFDRFPHVIAVAGSAATSDPEDEFTSTLATVLRGLAND